MEEKDCDEGGTSEMNFAGLTFADGSCGVYVSRADAEGFKFEDCTFTDLRGVALGEGEPVTVQ